MYDFIGECRIPSAIRRLSLSCALLLACATPLGLSCGVANSNVCFDDVRYRHALCGFKHRVFNSALSFGVLPRALVTFGRHIWLGVELRVALLPDTLGGFLSPIVRVGIELNLTRRQRSGCYSLAQDRCSHINCLI